MEGNDLYIEEIGNEKMKKGRKMEKEEEIAVHIFGCINFPPERRTFDGCVNPPNVQQLIQFWFCHCIDAMTFKKRESFGFFWKAATFY